MPETRRLTTIMSLDVAGYSRATERDDSAAAESVRNLSAFIAHTVSPLGGRIFSTAGDGFMLEFPSAASGVRAAMALLKASQAGEQSLPQIRVGLHLGDVIAQENGDLLGHGVNVAARLQALAEPGTAIVSETVRAQVRSAADIPLLPQGRVRLDKMSENLAVYSLSVEPNRAFVKLKQKQVGRRALLAGATLTPIAGIGVAGWLWQREQRPEPAQDVIKLAVLPFNDVGANPSPGFISQGLPREIRDRLSRVRGLRVIADTSSFQAAAEELSNEQVGLRLGAELLLGGSVRVEQERIWVNAELVDSQTSALAWTHSYDGDIADLAAAEADIFQAMLDYLLPLLGPERVQAAFPERRRDPVVYRMLVEARDLSNRANALTNQSRGDEAAALRREAERLFNEVLQRDGENPDALSALAWLTVRGLLSGAAPSSVFDRWSAASALYRRALVSDPNNVAALAGMAEFYRRYEWRWAESERLFARALSIDPNFADAHGSHCYLLSTVGRCIEGLRHARVLDSIRPGSGRLAIARLTKGLGDFGQVDRLYELELRSYPQNAFLIREIHINYVLRSDPTKLRALAGLVRDLQTSGSPSPPIADLLNRIEAAALALEGRPQSLLQLIEADAASVTEALARGDVLQSQGRFNVDQLYTLSVEAAAAGATERAIDLLEQAIAGRSLYIAESLPYGPTEFTPAMRAHPRYHALWRSDPALVELAPLRLAALNNRQMAGTLPNGRQVRPRAYETNG